MLDENHSPLRSYLNSLRRPHSGIKQLLSKFMCRFYLPFLYEDVALRGESTQDKILSNNGVAEGKKQQVLLAEKHRSLPLCLWLQTITS